MHAFKHDLKSSCVNNGLVIFPSFFKVECYHIWFFLGVGIKWGSGEV
jgi:hypothetical protein